MSKTVPGFDLTADEKAPIVDEMVAAARKHFPAVGDIALADALADVGNAMLSALTADQCWRLAAAKRSFGSGHGGDISLDEAMVLARQKVLVVPADSECSHASFINPVAARLAGEIERVRVGIHAIMDAALTGKVCECDVLWFDMITTLWEKLDELGGGDSCQECGQHGGNHTAECAERLNGKSGDEVTGGGQSSTAQKRIERAGAC